MAPNTLKITMLVDNGTREHDNAPDDLGCRPELVSEHGLSMLIETDGRRILLDTGQGPALQANASALGIALSETDDLVLSHGHYDHTGGLPHALAHATHAHVHCHPTAAQVRYSVAQRKARSIGMPDDSLRALLRLSAETIRWVLGPSELCNGVGLTGPIPRLTDYEDTGGPFYLDEAGWRPDPIEDDMAVWIRTKVGLVVCLGCAHAGVVNSLDWVTRLNPGEKIHAIIGGLHLTNASENRIEKTAKALSALNLAVVVPCHCTGTHAFDVMAQVLGERVKPGASGLVLEF